MKKILLLFLCSLFSLNIEAQPPEGHGQNLVPNADFESLIGRKPESDVDGSGIFRYNVVGWKSPTTKKR